MEENLLSSNNVFINTNMNIYNIRNFVNRINYPLYTRYNLEDHEKTIPDDNCYYYIFHLKQCSYLILIIKNKKVIDNILLFESENVREYINQRWNMENYYFYRVKAFPKSPILNDGDYFIENKSGIYFIPNRSIPLINVQNKFEENILENILNILRESNYDSEKFKQIFAK